MQEDANELALLDLGQLQLREPLARIDIILRARHQNERCEAARRGSAHLAAHEHDEDPSPDVRVHALLPRQLQQHVLTGCFCIDRGFALLRLLMLGERVTAPRRADEPPLALALRVVQVVETHAEGLMRYDCDNCQRRAEREGGGVPWRFLLRPETNFLRRSTVSAPALLSAAFFTLLFLRLVNVSTIKRVRELVTIQDGVMSGRGDDLPHRIRLTR